MTAADSHVPEPLCIVGADIRLHHDWSASGACRRCGVALPKLSAPLSASLATSVAPEDPLSKPVEVHVAKSRFAALRKSLEAIPNVASTARERLANH